LNEYFPLPPGASSLGSTSTERLTALPSSRRINSNSRERFSSFSAPTFFSVPPKTACGFLSIASSTKISTSGVRATTADALSLFIAEVSRACRVSAAR
jgi:hypothetical protein